VTLRELNRTLLARQLLLGRGRLSAAGAVRRLVALQAQYPPSPYVALWSRVEGFKKERLTNALRRGTVVKGWPMRGTLHVTTPAVFADLRSGFLEALRGRRLDADVDALREAIGQRPLTAQEAKELAAKVLGTDDRWVIEFALRRIPFVRTPREGPWPHTKPTPMVLWSEPLPAHDEALKRIVRAYLAAYGPATRADVAQFTGFRLGLIDPALEGMRRIGERLFDVPRGRLVAGDTPAPVRLLPPFDSIILAHHDRSRIVPRDYYETVIRSANATTTATFTVDGFVAGSWRMDGAKLKLEPFAPLPVRVRREVEAEAERLEAFYRS
jgi:hypothetical protein